MFSGLRLKADARRSREKNRSHPAPRNGSLSRGPGAVRSARARARVEQAPQRARHGVARDGVEGSGYKKYPDHERRAKMTKHLYNIQQDFVGGRRIGMLTG
jgi:hypothetical protein